MHHQIQTVTLHVNTSWENLSTSVGLSVEGVLGNKESHRLETEQRYSTLWCIIQGGGFKIIKLAEKDR